MVERNVAEIAAGPRTRGAPARRRATAGAWPLLLLAGYGLAYLLVRMQLAGALELDEAEIVYLVQEPRPGYGTQPPLYAWLQWLVFSLFGVNLFAVVLLKDLLLMACYALMYRAARCLLDTRGALAASATLALLPQVGWEFLRIQTHSVLATAIACATLWAYFALLRHPGPWRWLAMGLLCALGLQAKYNFACLLAALLAASLLVPQHRRALWNRATAPAACAALLLALLLLLPHVAWVVQHPEAAFGATVRKMQDGMAQAGYLRRVAAGLGQVLGSLAGFALLPALAFGLLAWPLRRRLRIERHAPIARFFLCLYGALLVQLGLLALSGEVGTVKERWMTPLFVTLPLAAFVLAPALRTRSVYLRAWRAGLLAALAFLALLPLRHATGAADGAPASYAALAQALRQRCPDAATIVSDSLVAAGNLRLADPARRVVLLDGALGAAWPAGGRVALAASAPSGALAQLRAAAPELAASAGEGPRVRVEASGGRTLVVALACLGAPGR